MALLKELVIVPYLPLEQDYQVVTQSRLKILISALNAHAQFHIDTFHAGHLSTNAPCA